MRGARRAPCRMFRGLQFHPMAVCAGMLAAELLIGSHIGYAEPSSVGWPSFKRVPARPRRLVCSIRKFSSLFSSRDVRKVERLASFRQRGPCIAQTGIMFALFGIVSFLRQRGALGGRSPCYFALGSHLVLSHSDELTPRQHYIATTADRLRAGCHSLFLARENVGEVALGSRAGMTLPQDYRGDPGGQGGRPGM